MPFLNWVNQSDANRGIGAAVSQVVMQCGFTAATTDLMLFQRLSEWVRSKRLRYEGAGPATSLNEAIPRNAFNCYSLSSLLKVVYCAVHDLEPRGPLTIALVPGVQTQHLATRRLSKADAAATIRSFSGNVKRLDVPGELRYTFAEHVYLRINGVDFDLLMGTWGAAVLANFPINVITAADGSLTCALPGPAGRPGMVQYRLRLVGGALYELVAAAPVARPVAAVARPR